MDVVAPKRSPLEKKAFKMWAAAGRPRQLKWIADELGVSPEMIRKWKHYYRWEEREDPRPGAPRGNKNAVGNKGGAPKGNRNAFKHGLYAKYLPEEVLQIAKEIEESDPLDMLWSNIILLQAKLLHSQKITHVRDRDDMTRELKSIKPGKFGDEVTYELQFAWDKFAAASQAEIAIMREFRAAVKQFLDVAPENDERRAKLELMQAQVEKVRAETKELERIAAENDPGEAGDDGFIDALRGKAAEVWCNGEQDEED